jgi:hypothetical protein
VKQGTYIVKFYAKHVSVGELDDQYFQVSFDSEPPSEDEFDLSRPDHPYLIVQRQFEDDDGGRKTSTSRWHLTWTRRS